MRYALDENGGAASLESFYSMYDAFVQTEEQIDSIQIKEPPKKQEYFPDGPPCLNRLAEEGFGEDLETMVYLMLVYTEKNLVLMIGKICWSLIILVMDPPLGNTEVQMLIKSLKRKDYDKYKCKEQPICGVCKQLNAQQKCMVLVMKKNRCQG